jgi:hypothetical protein
MAQMFASAPVELRQSPTREIEAYVHEHGIGKGNVRKRAKAGELLKEARIEQWRASESDRVQPDADKAKLPRLPVRREEAGKGRTLLPAASSVAVIGRSNVRPRVLSEKDPNEANVIQGRLLPGASDHRVAKDFPKDPNIDPRLYDDLDSDYNNDDIDRAALEALESLVVGRNADTEERATDASEMGALLRSQALETAAMDDTLVIYTIRQSIKSERWSRQRGPSQSPRPRMLALFLVAFR